MSKTRLLLSLTALFVFFDCLTTLYALQTCPNVKEASIIANFLAVYMPMPTAVALMKTAQLSIITATYLLYPKYSYRGPATFSALKQTVPAFSLTVWVVGFNILVISVGATINNLLTIGALI